MSASPRMVFPADLSDIPAARLVEALPEVDWRAKYPDAVQDRIGEEQASVSVMEELRAIYTSPWFWQLADLLPHNRIDRPGFGRPRDYPDWLLFLLDMAAGIAGIGSRRGAITLLRDARTWADFVAHVDMYVPEGFTRLCDIAHDDAKHARRLRPRAIARTVKTAQVTALDPVRTTVSIAGGAPTVACPADHHLDYFAQMWRGKKKVNGNWVPMDPNDAWYGVRQRVLETFTTGAVQQAMAMGLLDADQPFGFQRANRNQFVGFDGTVMDMPRRKANPHATSCDTHTICGGTSKAFGSKFTIASTRINGQYGSRIILDFAHTGRDPHSRYATESDAVLDMAPRLRDLTQGGMRGVLVDSIVRGQAVIDLQRQSVTVVNYPHALENPERETKGRLADTRVEKSHLRGTYTHKAADGRSCTHALYWVGGELVERFMDYKGDDGIRRVTIKEYQQRVHPTTGTRREYFIVTIQCAIAGDFTERIALFHTDSTSTDPDYNWGEVVRVFAPSGAEARFLYGGRNDTESRHTNIKARAKYLPIDVPGQELRMLGAAVTMNAVAWQIHLQAHGENNVLDNTA